MGVPVDTRMAKALAVPARARLLGLMRAAGAPSTVAGLAASVGLHINTTRVHLDRLVEVGLAERVSAPALRPGRPAVLYRSRPAGTGSADGYRELATVLADELSATDAPDRAAERAGERWARVVALANWPDRVPDPDRAVALLVDLLQQLGFDPQPGPPGDRINLRTCPFADVARLYPAVVCGVHRGLLRGTIRRLRAPLAVTAVDAFAGDHLCVIHLAPTGTAGTTPRSPGRST